MYTHPARTRAAFSSWICGWSSFAIQYAREPNTGSDSRMNQNTRTINLYTSSHAVERVTTVQLQGFGTARVSGYVSGPCVQPIMTRHILIHKFSFIQ